MHVSEKVKIRLSIVFLVFFMASMSAAIHACSWEAKQGSDQRGGEMWTPEAWTAFLADGPIKRGLPDFSYAGFAMGDRPIPEINRPVFDVTDPCFGARADDGEDDTNAIQSAIDAAEKAGGGVVLIPRGRYVIHSTVDGPFLRIRHSGIVLRGQGSGEDGSIINSEAPAPAQAIHRLGTVPAQEEARHGAMVAVMGAETARPLTAYTGDVLRGSHTIGVSDSAALKAGQPVRIEFTDPAIDPAHPTPAKVDLAAQLTSPFQLVPSQTDTFGAIARKHTWLVEIETIIDRNTIRLSKPARFDQWARYRPQVETFDGVLQVGIEHLRLQSNWPGNYRHHKPCLDARGKVIRGAKEQDYLWNGIWISSAMDCWVTDVAFKNLTQGIIVSRSGQITLQGLQFHGHAGHAGVTIAHSNDILMSGADFYARLVHPVTLKTMAAGNVVTDCRTHYEGRDERDATDAAIDFHGILPYENLFEDLDGFYVCPGGDLSVMPHAGVRNVFWNIRAPRCMTCYSDAKDNEFARSYDLASTSSGTAATMFEHLPQAFYIGIQRRDNLPIMVGGSALDRTNGWMTVQGLNRPRLSIPSLYQAQRKLRGQRSE